MTDTSSHAPAEDPAGGHSVTNAQIRGHNIQIGSARDILILLDRPNYRLEFLLPTGPARYPRSQMGPSYLLDPRREIVPFRRRPAEEERLEHWRDDVGLPVSVLMLSGPGGAGKSRLASTFASASHRLGWAVAQAVERTPRLGTSGSGQAALADGQPLLVVVDYAERWQLWVLAAMVESLPFDYPNRRLRLLLLARPHTVWDVIAAELDQGGTDLAEPVPLGTFAERLLDRAVAYSQAAAAFTKQLRIAAPPPVPPADLGHKAYSSPLTLHMAALAAVCAKAQDEAIPTRSNLSRYLLGHERRYWTATKRDGVYAQVEVIERVVFASTLLGPADDALAAHSVLCRLGLADGAAEANRLLTCHRRLYPEDGTQASMSPRPIATSVASGDFPASEELFMSPLRPDRLGEDFVGEHLAGNPQETALLSTLLDQASDLASAPNALAVRRCLAVLTAASARHDAARTAVLRLLERKPQLALFANAEVIATVTRHASYELAATIEGELFELSADLLRPVCELAYRLLTDLSTDAPEENRANRLSRLGTRLSQLGNFGEALACDLEALLIYQRLGEADPVTHLPSMSLALLNLGVVMTKTGANREALGPLRLAVDAQRHLVEIGEANQLPSLASSLGNLGACLSGLGEVRAALECTQEAVQITRGLSNAGETFYLRKLANHLLNSGNQLIQVGEVRAALEAQEEAIGIYRRLLRTEATACLPDLAAGLSALGVSLALVGQRQAALEHTQEAAAIYRGLAEDAPAAYLRELAGTLINCGERLGGAGQPQAALQLTREAVSICRRLVQAQPKACLPLMALAVSNLAVRLGELGDTQAALAPGREAVHLYRCLSKDEPVAYHSELARALHNLDMTLAREGDTYAAVEVGREAVDIYRNLHRIEPRAHLPEMAEALNSLSVRLGECRRLPEAENFALESVTVFRRLAQEEPAAYEPGLARALHNLGSALRVTGKFRSALKAAQEATSILEPLAAQSPHLFANDLRNAHEGLANLRGDLSNGS